VLSWKSRRFALALVIGAIIGLSVAHTAWAQDKKPNIVVIMGDDIGMWNIGAYHRGMMAGRTPNLDKIAKEGMLFTDYYAEASCTAGRANFITGELPIRTGMTTVGQAGAKIGIPAEEVTIATVLKSMGYATGQFGKIHLGISMSSCPPSTASTNSSAICITSTRWKTRHIPTIRRIC
jgi:arylsulfatase